MFSQIQRNKELIPLLTFVIGGVSFGSSMFLYKCFTNPNLQFKKENRKKIIRE